MSVAVKVSELIAQEARLQSKVFNRSVGAQVDYWARIGKIAEENPDLSFDFIKQLLIAKQEVELGLVEPFEFDDDK